MNWGWLKTLFGAGSGGGVIGKGLDLIAERTEDVDKRNASIVELVRMQIDADRNPVWIQALPHWATLTFGARLALSAIIWAYAVHLLARVGLWGWVLWLYVDMSRASGQPVDLETLALMVAGPGLYTLLKGKGR
jgi:hypothetical protein